ncbi:MAG: proton-conducting transporter membrane subunit [Planctomycetaceae bacterium]
MSKFITLLGVVVVGSPVVLLIALGGWSLTGRRFNESVLSRAISATIAVGLLASIAVLAHMLVGDSRHVVIAPGSWVAVPGYHFSLRFVFDRLSVPFAILTYVLCGTIGAFGRRYLHREPGYDRFFVLYSVFLTGMVTASLAGTIETLFAGWELVGLSSALLVAFFQERPAPVRNGLRVWSVYRVSDAAFLMAALLLHRMTGEGDFDQLAGTGFWPYGEATLSSTQALTVGLLLLVAAAGKSALVPFSGWLPRAMEGPTPSSAVFYGSLSVHLGAFLLLRVSPILVLSPLLCGIIVALGLTTAVFAALTERVQTDIKSALSYASLTQVGIIVAEIGLLPPLLGPWACYIPLVHILGHACLRTLQFLRAPTLLQDYRLLENAIGTRLPRSRSIAGRLVARPVQIWLYRFAVERCYLDSWLDNYVVGPVLGLFRSFDRLERRWTAFLTGGTPRTSEHGLPPTTIFEER